MGRKPIDPTGIKTERVSLVLGQHELSAIDEWRRSEARMPSRSQAIRHLANRGLLLSEALEYASGASSRPLVGQGKKALIIEDDRSIALVMNIVLSSMGFDVIGTTASPDEAIELSLTHRPNIIISETVIGRKDIGIELVNSIIERISAMTIFCTSNPEFFLAGLHPEQSYLMTKPIQVQALADVAKKAIESGLTSRSGNNS